MKTVQHITTLTLTILSPVSIALTFSVGLVIGLLSSIPIIGLILEIFFAVTSLLLYLPFYFVAYIIDRNPSLALVLGVLSLPYVLICYFYTLIAPANVDVKPMELIMLEAWPFSWEVHNFMGGVPFRTEVCRLIVEKIASATAKGSHSYNVYRIAAYLKSKNDTECQNISIDS